MWRGGRSRCWGSLDKGVWAQKSVGLQRRRGAGEADVEGEGLRRVSAEAGARAEERETRKRERLWRGPGREKRSSEMLTGRERGLDRAASFVMRCVRFVSGGIVPASFGQPTLETQVSDLEFVSPASEGGSYTRGGARRVEIGTLFWSANFRNTSS